MYTLYRSLTYALSPFIPYVLRRRLARGKEDAVRLPERLGHATLTRPDGKLLWIHAASVGEANAALPLIDALIKTYPQLHILLTTVTVTSATLMEKRLPAQAIHQYAPVDTPQAVHGFLDHWRPDIALWVDSEFWPNLIMESHSRGIVMGVINARMSASSFRIWNYFRPWVKGLFASFGFCFAQSAIDAERLSCLGMHSISHIGNLKYDAPALPCDEQELQALKASVNTRPHWLAVSTHPGEEEIISRAHTRLKEHLPDILTFIIPRHSRRGDAIAGALKNASLNVAQRSHGESLRPETDIYLADTMGELGLFCRLARIVLMGGSLVEHGGQNPLEAARLGCAILLGPHMENFPDICRDLEHDKACIRVGTEEELTAALMRLFSDTEQSEQLSRNALQHVQLHSGMVAHIMQALEPTLSY